MTIKRAQEIIDQFSSKKVLVVGDVVLDQYIYGTVERINPEAPVPILHAHKAEEMTGGAGNVAKNVASLGGEATLISVTGDDGVAEELETAAGQENYTPRFVRDPSRPTIRKVRYIAASQQMLRVDYEETHPLSGELEQQIIGYLQELGSDTDAVIVSDYAKGIVSEALAKAILNISNTRAIPVAADLKPSRTAWFKGATFIAPNLKEGRESLGLDPFGHDQVAPEEIARKLHEKLDTSVFLTLSAKGIYLYTTDNPGHLVPQRHVVSVADTSGAGDVATVVLLLAQLCGATAIEAAELANAAGAVAVSRLGAVAVSGDEILAMLDSASQT